MIQERGALLLFLFVPILTNKFLIDEGKSLCRLQKIFLSVSEKVFLHFFYCRPTIKLISLSDFTPFQGEESLYWGWHWHREAGADISLLNYLSLGIVQANLVLSSLQRQLISAEHEVKLHKGIVFLQVTSSIFADKTVKF